ncbi:MAG: hypothetical protein Q8L86_02135 [Vicinamibacterales bacterium]|nr:hypothetical protein [Vicinamibacterales bacterium]
MEMAIFRCVARFAADIYLLICRSADLRAALRATIYLAMSPRRVAPAGSRSEIRSGDRDLGHPITRSPRHEITR